MADDWEKARDWLKQKTITRMSAKVPILFSHTKGSFDYVSFRTPIWRKWRLSTSCMHT